MTAAALVEPERQLRIELVNGERLLWCGIPKQGMLLRASDAVLIPFSFLWGGFAIFWELGVWTARAPFFFRLWGIPFVLVGLYLVAGRFFVDAITRSRTYYGVTDQRILIIGGFRSRQVKSLSMRGATEISLVERADQSGTITFGSGMVPAGFNAFGNGWPGSGARATPSFEGIKNARMVYELIRKAQRDDC